MNVELEGQDTVALEDGQEAGQLCKQENCRHNQSPELPQLQLTHGHALKGCSNSRCIQEAIPEQRHNDDHDANGNDGQAPREDL